ncbi:UDP-N-acetylmuramoyl-tripeptide--D-alanyl-D-alanine ligase [Methylohalomonas lacus]|nr:UDP-N-acetylmuramoyl-tripeptide--D-alanyl-D-alanine ligase [Methylohalomonas lacus]
MIALNTAELAQLLTAQQHGGAADFRGACTDSRQLTGGELFIALRGPNFDGHDFVAAAQSAGASALLVERVLDSELPQVVVPDTRRALGTLAAAWRQRFDLPLIAVTGSNGKTTVKEMLRAILGSAGTVLSTRGNLNNDIGVPLTLYGLGDEHDYAVIEMGANHPGEIDYLSRISQPDVALITQCAPAHLEGFGSIEGVARAKAEIFNGLGPQGCAVINADDDYAGLWQECNSERKRLSFGIDRPADVHADNIHIEADASSRFQLVTPIGQAELRLPLPGRHNIMNALAASAAVTALGFEPAAIAAALAELEPVAGRLARYSGPDGSLLLDDSYNANPGSLAAAIAVVIALPARPWLVLGDMGELGEQAEAMHRAAGEQAHALGIERLYAVGELSRAAVAGFGDGGRHFDALETLIDTLRDELGNGVAVLVKGSRSARMERVIDALTRETA